MLYAHSKGGSVSDGESLADHLNNVAEIAERFGERFGAGAPARAAGLLHDIGKASDAFQRYIIGEGTSPDHSTAGAVEAERRYPGALGRLIAFAVAGHHAGLADGAALADRLNRDLPPHKAWETLELDLPATLAAGLPGPPRLNEPGYSIAFLGRMIFSCLVDADFLATEGFYGEKARGGHSDLKILRARLDAHLAAKMAGAAATPLNVLRAEILAHARAKATTAPGLFTMTVPTGGGKTLAGLAFALDHAIAHGLDRVVYVIPYTSIVEQTAAVFREALGDADVLEHHGAFDWDRDGLDADGADVIAKLHRAAENWNVPVVVTTAVQFFESLHANRTSACRKLHRLARSVVVLDEAQTLPVHLLRPCMAAIEELTRCYGTTTVLCTATQPALGKRDGFERGGLDIPEGNELAPDPVGLYKSLKRVTVRHAGPMTDAALADRFAAAERMLLIVNSRAQAQALFALIRDLPGARHLTTLMCPAHRRLVLAEVREELRLEHPVRLVATSLIEAGVDVDFPEVWRAETGLDSIAQAAGRCNREGRLATAETVVFEAADHRLPDQFRQQVAAMQEALRRHSDDPLGLDAVRAYFRHLYWTKGEEALDAGTMEGRRYPILPHLAESIGTLHFPFESVARAFRMIDNRMEPVIVPWRGGADPDEPRRLIDALRYAPRPPGDVVRKLQQYTVSVPSRARAAMLASGAVQVVSPELGDRFVALVSDRLYDERTGLSLDPFAMPAEAGIF